MNFLLYEGWVFILWRYISEGLTESEADDDDDDDTESVTIGVKGVKKVDFSGTYFINGPLL